MSVASARVPWDKVAQLRQRATRHRSLAEGLASQQDRQIALSEASHAELEAGRIVAELGGMLLGTVIPAPLYEQF